MANELTKNELIYCQKFLEIGTKAGAYKEAYSCKDWTPRAISAEACKVHKRKKILAEIARLQNELRERHGITLDNLTEKLEEARELAMRTANPAAAVSSVVAMARMHGLFEKDEGGDGGEKFMISISKEIKKKGEDS